jgi:tetratricopeptide (TPR) repeat protein
MRAPLHPLIEQVFLFSPSPKQEETMRFSTLVGVAVFSMLVGLVSEAVADNADTIKTPNIICADAHGPADKRISACTELIKETSGTQQLSDLYNNRGTAYADKNDQDSALADYTYAIQLNPDNSVPYTNRGDLHYQKGDIDSAIEDYNTALRLQPTFERAYIGRTAAFLKKNDAQGALNSADQMISNEPNSAIAVETRAYVLKIIGRRDEAIADYRKALKMASSIPELQREIEADLRELGAAP